MGHNGDRGLFSHLGQMGLNNMFTTQLFGKSSGGYSQSGQHQYGAHNSQAAENTPHGYPSGHTGSGFLAGGGAAYGAHHVSNGYGSHGDGSHGYASHGYGGYGHGGYGHGGYGHGGYGQHHGVTITGKDQMIFGHEWWNRIFNKPKRTKQDIITPSIRKEIKHLKEAQKFWIVYHYGNKEYEVRKGDASYGVNIEKRTCACKWDIKSCKKDKQPKLTVEKRKPRRKKVDSNFVFPNGGKDGGDASPSVADPTIADLIVTDPTVEKRKPRRKKVDSNFVFPTGGKDGGDASPSVADPTIADLIVTDPTVAEPSVADPTGLETSYAGDTGFVNKDETVTEDPIKESQVDDIPT
uniref:Glycine-rich protein A3 n=1 Tax=Tanacetum cinerariifolium TaxID=118510 RepID=A0A6L2J775_TANCI|nr:glycine-rich protein A3 [Tanacetum cinerariifolium]